MYKRLEKLKQYTPNSEESLINEVPSQKNVKASIHVTIFSDSVIIFSKDDSLQSFRIFSLYVSYFVSSALANNIPLKGAISYGETYINKNNNIACGQAIIDAYLLEEELQYMGIILHHSFEEYYKNKISDSDLKNDAYLKYNKNKNRFFSMFKELDTPLKSGRIKHNNIDLFNYIELTSISDPKNKDNKVEALNSCIESFKYTMSGSVRKYYDNTHYIIKQIMTISQNNIEEEES